MKTLSRFALLALVASLAACSALESDKIDYKSAGKAPTLEVPPDLTQLSRDNRYVVPGGPVSATAFQTGIANAPGAPTAVSVVGDVRMETSGTQRWLVVNRSPDQLWEPIKDFWQESGFLLTTDQRNLGIMETDWAENRAKLPQDIIRGTLGKMVDSLYSTGELDRFRTRLERTANGTEVFVSHRGMIEVYSNSQKDQTIWQPRPADRELETEFLRRLMVKLGVPQEQSKALVASGSAPVERQRATVSDLNGQPIVTINDGFDRAWRRVGLTLDRTGFTVEDRDRAAGTYFVRYVPPDRKEPGALAKLITFGQAGKGEAPLKLRVLVKSEADTSVVSVLDQAGAPEKSDNAKKIVQVIADDLK
ncbi:outer membrane protein assembly factor BamC [Variovorax sp. J22R133]|uniref:outer membrane protein assembly factor BamC n=1 Tax=Variovorax brevis TaxID=3053503 RepID=UPI0025761482|nr:outer membrane protein assembly factor BamC [Variovorax sp. J22R133]MDM0113382.1 outer membrane protein assembly factor BamC [Variovorax sp. J22R133]